MKLHNERWMRISKLKLSGVGVDPTSKQIARSIAELEHMGVTGGVMQRILVSPDGTVLEGEAHVLGAREAGKHSVRVRMVDCDEVEASLLQSYEVAHRRGNKAAKAEAIAMLVDRLTEKLSQGEPPKKNKRKTPKSRAYDCIAGITGMGRETVRRWEWKHKCENPEQLPKSPPRPTVNTFGMELAPEFVVHLAQGQGCLKAADDALGRVLGCLKGWMYRQPEEHRGVIVGLMRECNAFRDTLSKHMPVSLCAWCKGQDGVQETCEVCGGKGYNVAGDPDPPPELQSEDPLKVVHLGEVKSLEDLSARENWLELADDEDPFA